MGPLQVYERRRHEKRLREKEANYQEHLKNWEAREKRRAKEYAKDREKVWMKNILIRQT